MVVRGRADFAMMDSRFFEKSPRLPTFHSCPYDRVEVDPTRFNGSIPADPFETLASEQLTASGNMFSADDTVVVLERIVLKGRTGNSQPWILQEATHKKCKIILIKGQIGVQVADDIKVDILKTSLPGLESANLTSKIPFAPLRHSYEFDPIVLNDIALHDFVGAIGRTIAHDDPFGRP